MTGATSRSGGAARRRAAVISACITSTALSRMSAASVRRRNVSRSQSPRQAEVWASWVARTDRSRGAAKSAATMGDTPRWRSTSTGRVLRMPPSSSSRGPSSTGAKAPGKAVVARRAVTRLPRSITTSWPLSMSVAVTTRGTASSSKVAGRWWPSHWAKRWPRISPPPGPKSSTSRQEREPATRWHAAAL